MTKLVLWFQQHKRVAAAFILLSFVLLSGCAFPFYNLTKPLSGALWFTNLFVNYSVYRYMGAFLAQLRPRAGLGSILLMNLGIVLGGMLFRWVLEFGEISNVYNFTPVNIALHLAATMAVATFAWWQARK